MRKITKEEKVEFIGNHLRKYTFLYALLMGLIATFELVFFIRGALLFKFSSYRHYLYMASYVFLFVVSVISSITLFIGKKKYLKNKTYNILLYFYYISILLWALAISFVDMQVGNMPIVYLTVVVTVAGVVIIDPYFFASTLLISYVALILSDVFSGLHCFNAGAAYLNCSVFIIMAGIIGFRHFYMTFRQYKNTEILELSVREERERVSAISLQTIMSINNAVDAKDKYTREHSQRVAEYSREIAIRLNWDKAQCKELHQIALLHDIGKIGVPDSILNCTTSLTKEEFDLMKMHTVIGGEILKDLTILKNVDLGAKYHHERYDGTGYPSGLKGEDIPIEARIIAVADAFDAMHSNRIYRKHLTKEKILSELIEGKGKQFDPNIIDIFLPYVKELFEEENK